MKKYYPLTPAQMLHQNWIKQYDTQQVAGISAMAVLKMEIDYEILEKSINEELVRQKCLCFRFTEDEKTGEILQYYVKHKNQKFKLEDLTDISYQEAEAKMQSWAYELLKVYDGPMYDIRLLKLAEGFNGFFIHVDHRLMDGCAMATLLNDIMLLYTHYKFGTEYPEMPADFEEVLQKDLSRVNNPTRRASAKAFWDGQLKEMGEPLYSDFRGEEALEDSRKLHKNKKLRAADIEHEDLMVKVKNYYLEPEATDKLIEFCKEKSITMTNLLLLGLRTYLSKVNNGQEDITIENFISRRTTKEQWTSGGCRTIMFPCRSKFSAETEFLDAANKIKDIQTRVYSYNNYDPMLINDEIIKRYNTPKDTSYESCYLTYQPMAPGFNNPKLKDVEVRYKWFSNGAATKKMYLTVSHTPNGGMCFSFHYQRACLDEHDMELIYYYLMRILFAGINNPGITLGEIMQAV